MRMEGVVSRSGRIASRYGPATVFSGPVRKWKKRWVPIYHHNTSNGFINYHNNHNPSSSSHINRNGSTAIGTSSSSNGNNSSSHLLLYKWTALSQANCNNNNSYNGSPADHGNGDNNSGKDDDSDSHEPPKRKFKYVPVDLLEKQKEEGATKEAAEKETAEKADDEVALIEVDPTPKDTDHKPEDLDEKSDINATPMEEIQNDEQGVRQSTLDLSLGLNSRDGESDSRPDKSSLGHNWSFLQII